METDQPIPQPTGLSPKKSSLLRSLFRISKVSILAIALIAALVLNIATLTVGAVYDVMSSAIEFVAARSTVDLLTIRSKHRAEVSTLKNANARLAGKLDGATHVRFKGQRRTIKSAVRETTQGISRRVAKATARSTGSVLGESIPYLGIGAIIAVTAWEIHDACETMKDLHELEVAFNPEAADDPTHSEVCGAQVPTKDEIITALKDSPSSAWEKVKALAAHPPSVPSLPDWQDTVASAKASWYKVAEAMKDTLGL